MGKTTGKMPSAPSPFEMLAAQNNLNEEALKKALKYSQIKTKTPIGSVEYTGKLGSKDRAKEYKLSPQMRREFNQSHAIKNQMQEYALNEINRKKAGRDVSFKDLPDINPIDRNAIEKQAATYYTNQSKKLDPYFKNQSKHMDIRLGQRGFSEDTHAYKNAQEALYKSQASTLKDLGHESEIRAQQSENTAVQNRMASRTQKLKERFLDNQQPMQKINWAMNVGGGANHSAAYNALNALGGNAGERGVSSMMGNIPNITNAFQQNYANNMKRYQEKQKRNQAMMGGLFSLGKNFLI